MGDVISVMTSGELDVCGFDSCLVYDETGEVVSVDDVLACGDDTLLPDAFLFRKVYYRGNPARAHTRESHNFLFYF